MKILKPDKLCAAVTDFETDVFLNWSISLKLILCLAFSYAREIQTQYVGNLGFELQGFENI